MQRSKPRQFASPSSSGSGDNGLHRPPNGHCEWEVFTRITIRPFIEAGHTNV
jgi:hypothetical protein